MGGRGAGEVAGAEEPKIAWGSIPHAQRVTLGKLLPLSESISPPAKWRDLTRPISQRGGAARGDSIAEGLHMP